MVSPLLGVRALSTSLTLAITWGPYVKPYLGGMTVNMRVGACTPFPPRHTGDVKSGRHLDATPPSCRDVGTGLGRRGHQLAEMGIPWHLVRSFYTVSVPGPRGFCWAPLLNSCITEIHLTLDHFRCPPLLTPSSPAPVNEASNESQEPEWAVL